MNNRSLTAILVFCAALFVALYSIVSITSGQGNSIGNLCKYVAIASIFMGVLTPKGAVFVCLIGSAYLDLFKRMLVFAGSPSYLDLIYVLSIVPLAMLGASIGTVVALSVGGSRRWTKPLFCFFVGSVVIFFIGAIVARSGGLPMAAMLRYLANGPAYAVLLFWFRRTLVLIRRS